MALHPARAAGQEVLRDLAPPYLEDPEITMGRMFGSDGLAVRDKFFAFVGGEGRLMVKLPASRCAELIADGSATDVTLGNRTMREWVAVGMVDDPSHALWRSILAEAHEYVDSVTPRA